MACLTGDKAASGTLQACRVPPRLPIAARLLVALAGEPSELADCASFAACPNCLLHTPGTLVTLPPSSYSYPTRSTHRNPWVTLHHHWNHKRKCSSISILHPQKPSSSYPMLGYCCRLIV